MKSAFVSLVGRPSSGKSTLLNRICGNKVSIVSTVPQTTRNKIRGILTRKEGQLVFIDTPGFHKSDRKFSLYMRDLISSTLKEVDMALYLVDLSRSVGEEETELARILSSSRLRIIVGFNKVDLDPPRANKIKNRLREMGFEGPSVDISALTGEGVEKLLGILFDMAPEGDLLYPKDYYTDQDPEFRIAEIIREKAVSHTRQEVPHSLFVEIADSEMQEKGLWVRGFIHVERQSQKGILIGRGGSKIKTIRQEAERELNRLFPYRIMLDLRIKVSPKWRGRDDLLKKLVR